MYKIVIFTGNPDIPPLELKTKSRSVARSVVLLGQENKLKVEVVAEVEPRQVKFKGLG